MPRVLHDRPVLVLDPGMHTATINRADVDRDGTIAVTGSDDRTVRLWSPADRRLLQTIRVPQGPGNVGKIYAVAVDPAGEVVAAGGWTRITPSDEQEQIYLFDAKTGAMIDRIEGLSNGVGHLAFSPDGRRLAAMLARGLGFRLYDRGSGWAEVARDEPYGGDSYGAAFAPDGRLATTSWDGGLRLYDVDGALAHAVEAGHERPVGVAFDHDGGRIAVGFYDSTELRLFDGRTLSPLPGPDTGSIENGDFFTVAWSADGGMLYAGGLYRELIDGAGTFPVLSWLDGGGGARRTLPAGTSTVMSIRPLPDGDLLVAAADPWLGRLGPDGPPRWAVAPAQMDPREQNKSFSVSEDGAVVDFGYELPGARPARFDVSALKLTTDPPEDGRTSAPEQGSLGVEGWSHTTTPTLDGAPLPLKPFEASRSLAIHPDGKRFVLGTDWYLRAFDAAGAELWRKEAPGVAWAVNISGDGRLAVAAYGDGTIRWRRMEDGGEILALFPLIDGENWVAWTPEGVYAATPGARGMLRWHVNRGWDAAAEAVPVSAIPETHRPEVIPHVLPQLGTPGALAVAELAKIRGAVQRATGSDAAPGARLHVLAIGVSDYGDAARHLDLTYADHDARDIAAALRQSQSSLYAQVLVSQLVNGEAMKADIIRELRAVRDAMRSGNGNDLAVILFSGHGEIVDGDRFFLLPHGVDTSSADAMEDTALSSVDFHDRVAAIAQHGRVILFVDACRSGGATLPLDRSLRAMLAAPNVTVFASSKAGELSREHADWENGAFTEALLEALGKADGDRDGLIRISDLSGYLSERVPTLTGGAQRPDVEIHFDARVLAATA